MFCSQLKLRSLQVLQTVNLSLQENTVSVSGEVIDMLSSLFSPVVTIHLDIVFVNRAQTGLASLIVFTGGILFPCTHDFLLCTDNSGRFSCSPQGRRAGCICILMFDTSTSVSH